MTKEQEEAIERLNRFKTIEILYSNTFAMHIEQLKTLQEAIRELLNMLKEKDKEINRKSSTIKALQCALHERTEERDRKDYIIARQNEQIDLMAEKIFQDGIVWDDKEEIKQYFKSKATNDG